MFCCGGGDRRRGEMGHRLAPSFARSGETEGLWGAEPLVLASPWLGSNAGVLAADNVLEAPWVCEALGRARRVGLVSALLFCDRLRANEGFADDCR